MTDYMTNRQRMITVLNGEKPDRLPVIEWAGWWDQTVSNWVNENKSCPSDRDALYKYYGLDRHCQVCLSNGNIPSKVNNENDFKKLLPNLYTEQGLTNLRNHLLSLKSEHDTGDISVWFTFEGFFWFPRTVFGIENHLYAFYDYPELMHEMNERLTEYYKKAIEIIYEIITPEFMIFMEDMSYNHGPMLSEDLYNEFIDPYYKQTVPLIKKHGTKVLIDTDGFVEPMIPWLEASGIEGVLPLERQAGVDVSRIRKNHPEWIMAGGFDKTVMHMGEEAMRTEFERLLPVMKSGRYIPSVDHQTPPDVSIENYRIFVKLLKEYAIKAVI